MNIKTVVILFLIGFVSDLVLQAIGPSYPTINLFEPFWRKYGPIKAAAIAGLITLVFGGLFLIAAKLLYNFLNLQVDSWSFILFATALAFILGVVIDIYTNRGDWLGPEFRLWYDTMGETDAALWTGGLTFAFTVFVALVIIKFFS
jgi:hypothetical protein